MSTHWSKRLLKGAFFCPNGLFFESADGIIIVKREVKR